MRKIEVFFNKLFNYLWRTDIGNGILILSAFLLLAVILQGTSHWIISKYAREAIYPLCKADTIQNNTVNILFEPNKNTKLQVLKGQYYISEQLKRCYRDVAVEYYVNYYSFTVCFTVFTTILSLTLVWLGNQGWQTSKPKFRIFFLVCALFASFYYFTPKVLENESNLKSNLEQMKDFQGIQLDILSFTSSYNPIDSIKYNKMILLTDSLIKKNYDFIINIDPSQVGNNPPDIIKKVSDSNK